MKILPDFSIENSYAGLVAGVDEAGRGPWAGPVVAAAVIANESTLPPGINDSKKLKAGQRESLFNHIMQNCIVGVGISSSQEIDSINILKATMLAMQRAVASLSTSPDLVLVDGNKAPELPCKSIPIIKGDAKSLSIAAASIIAKVTRDRIMQQLSDEFPHYKWHKNSGYGTKDHQQAIEKYGITIHHRKSYKPIANLLAA